MRFGGAVMIAGGVGVAFFAAGVVLDAVSLSFAIGFYALPAVVAAALARGIGPRLAACLCGPLLAAVGAGAVAMPRNAGPWERALLAVPIVVGLVGSALLRREARKPVPVRAAAMGSAAPIAATGLMHVVGAWQSGAMPAVVGVAGFALGALVAGVSFRRRDAVTAETRAEAVCGAWLFGAASTAFGLVSGRWQDGTGHGILAVAAVMLVVSALWPADDLATDERTRPCWRVTLMWGAEPVSVTHVWRGERLSLHAVVSFEATRELVDAGGVVHVPDGWARDVLDAETVRLSRGALAIVVAPVDAISTWRRRRPLQVSLRATTALSIVGAIAVLSAGRHRVASEDTDDVEKERWYDAMMLMKSAQEREEDADEADGSDAAPRRRAPIQISWSMFDHRPEPPPTGAWTPAGDDTWCAFRFSPWVVSQLDSPDRLPPEMTMWGERPSVAASTMLTDLGVFEATDVARPREGCSTGDCVAPIPRVRLGRVAGGDEMREMRDRALRVALPRIRACYARGLRRDPSLAGNVTSRLHFDIRGVVADVEAVMLLMDGSVQDCVSLVLRRIELSQSLPRPVTVTVPIVLSSE